MSPSLRIGQCSSDQVSAAAPDRLRLNGGARTQFFAIVPQIMRRVLVASARTRGSRRRGCSKVLTSNSGTCGSTDRMLSGIIAKWSSAWICPNTFTMRIEPFDRIFRVAKTSALT